jgi:LysM repeat protein
MNLSSLAISNSESDDYIVQDGDNIQKLAKEYNVSWKLIARENDIKAPYNLESGETIKLLTTNKNSSKKATKKANSKSEKTIRRKNKS